MEMRHRVEEVLHFEGERFWPQRLGYRNLGAGVGRKNGGGGDEWEVRGGGARGVQKGDLARDPTHHPHRARGGAAPVAVNSGESLATAGPPCYRRAVVLEAFGHAPVTKKHQEILAFE